MRFVVRHTAVLVLEALAGLLAVAILAGGFLAVRLQGEEPLQLAFLTPYLEQALNDIDPEIKVAIGESLLSWSGWEHPLDLRARQVTVKDAEGHILATLPDLAVDLSWKALLLGDIAPDSIEVARPRLVVVRTPEGRLQLGFGETEAEAAAPFSRDVLQALLSPAKSRGYLRKILIRDGYLTVIDRRLGAVWRAPDLDLELRRSRRAVKLRAEATLEQPGGIAAITARLDVPVTREPASLQVNLAGLDPRSLGAILERPELARIDSVVGGTLNAVLERSGAIREVSFSLAAGPGRLDLPELYAEPLPVMGAGLRGRISEGFDRIDIAGGTLTLLDGPTVSLSGMASGLRRGEAIAASLELGTNGASTETVLRFWPERIAAAPRNWIAKNIKGGFAEEGHATLALTIPRDSLRQPVLHSAEAMFRASGLTLTYLDGLPPIDGVSGEGRLIGDVLTMTITGGHTGPLAVTGGTVTVSNFHQEPQILTIVGTVAGPFRAALELIDHKRLGYPSRIGLDPKTASGEATAHLRFELPAKKDIAIEEVKLRIEGKLAQAGLAGFVLGADLEQADVDLVIEPDGMDITGTASLAGGRAAIEWRENFTPDAPFGSRMVARGQIDGKGRKALGLETAPWVEGPTPLDLLYTRKGESATLAIDADLTQASMAAEPLGWKKAPGTPGRASAVLALEGEKARALDRVSITAGDLFASGKVSLDAMGKPERIALRELAWAGSRLRNVEIVPGAETLVRIGGGRFDASPVFDRRKAEAGQRAKEEPPGPPFRIVAPGLDELRTGEDRSLAGVSLDIANDGERWTRVTLTGELPGGKTVALLLGADASGHRRLSLTSDDAGALLRAARILDTVVGGTLSVEGYAKEPGAAAAIQAKAEAKDYRVVRGPVMAKILSQAKLEDVNRLLAKEGIPFAHFTAKMELSDEAVELDKARAYGAALGITAKGRIDLEADAIDIEGTIVPAYVVNQIIGEIPLIGRILTGGEGEGVFAATYTAKGPFDDPKVSVNPLAALAPGFLRGIFNVFEGEGGDEDFTPLPPREQQ